MNYVMGIDPSLTSTAVVILDEPGEIVRCDRIVSKPCGPLVSDRIHRYEGIVQAVFSSEYNPAIVCIEGYSMGSHTRGVIDRVELGALLRQRLVLGGYLAYEVPPTTLKKWATGKGSGDKTPLIVAMTYRYGVRLECDDEYDAYALARMAHQIAAYSVSDNSKQKDAIDVVRNPHVKASRRSK